MGLFGKLFNSKQTVKEEDNIKPVEWFFSEEAKARFEKFDGTLDAFMTAYKSNINESYFAMAFEKLSKGDTYYLNNRCSAYEQLEGDNILKFVTEYFDSLCQQEGVGNSFARNPSCTWIKSEYYFLMVYVCAELLNWKPDEDDGPETVVWSYPDGLKIPNNPIFNIMITMCKSNISFNYSDETINAIQSLLETVGSQCEKRLDITDPEIFEPSFYDHVEYKEEFVARLTPFIEKYKKE